jgi:hypothetical protein
MNIEAYDKFTQSFTHLNLLTAELRVENDKTTTRADRSPSSVEAVLKLLRKAEDLEKRYIEWQESLPSSWAYKTVSWVDVQGADTTSSFYHPGRIDSYGELWMVYTYNIARSCRLFIWTTILRCVAWLAHPRDYRITPEYTAAARVCGHLIEDIVASVPCFFGLNEQNDMCLVDRSNFACGSKDKSSPKTLSGIFSMWPLFVAAASDFATPSQRMFLKGRLKYIADTMGINQATLLVNVSRFVFLVLASNALTSPQAELEHPSKYIYRERMNMQPTGQCLPVEDNPGSGGTTIQSTAPAAASPTSDEKLAHNASASVQATSTQVCIDPQGQIPFDSPEPTTEQSGWSVPEDSWDIDSGMTLDSPEILEQIPFTEEVPVFIAPSACAPSKITDWAPRSFEDNVLLQDVIKQSPESELDFSNFVTV